MDSTVPKKEDAIDPFAEDVFSDAKKADETDIPSAKAKIEEDSEWFRKLPKAAPGACDWDSLLSNLSSEFFEGIPQRLAKSLSSFLILPDKSVFEFVFLVNREIKKREDLALDDYKSWWLRFGIADSDSEIAVEMTNVFAAWLVDAALGIENASVGREIRRLTQTELSVIEFLARNLVLETNRDLRSSAFEFRSITSKTPRWFDSALSPKNGASLLQLNFQTVHELLPSIVKIYASPESIEALRPGNNRNLRNRAPRFEVHRIDKTLEKIAIRLGLGLTGLSIAEIGSIETGDVVLIEETGLIVRDGVLSGSAEAFIGDDFGVKISGKVETKLPETVADEIGEVDSGNKYSVRTINIEHPLQFLIKDLSGRESRAKRRKFMTEEENDVAEKEAPSDDNRVEKKGGLAIEKIAVNMRVELDARRLTLKELSNLRENQILELSIAPNDAVNLIIDDRSIGRGELVSVNDRLGLRITKLLR